MPTTSSMTLAARRSKAAAISPTSSPAFRRSWPHLAAPTPSAVIAIPPTISACPARWSIVFSASRGRRARPGPGETGAQGTASLPRRSVRCGAELRTALGHRQHHDFGADINAGVEIGDVVIGQADATGRDVLADGIGCVGAVDAVDGAAEIHGAGAKRVAGAAGHLARQI